MIKINFESAIPAQVGLTQSAIKEIITEAIHHFDLTGSLEIEIIFVSLDEIRELNQEFRQIDKPTDVLSFPQTQVPNAKRNILGSIVINADKVIEKGECFPDVIKHGLLHLLGYDHETDEATWQIQANKINCEL